ncbi:MAG: winged helix-turn-helix domain-containing protein [bacterium]|nr:winged helix-turn-helix domain-containing protein [bacterium]
MGVLVIGLRLRGDTAIVYRTGLHARIANLQPSLLRLTAPAGYGKSAMLEQLARDGPSIFIPHLNNLDPCAIPDILTRWSAMPRGARLIIDNADALATDRERLMRACERLLVERPEGSCLAFAGREPAYFYERAVAPHDVLVLGANDLRFAHAEIAEIFAATDLPWQALHRIEQIAHGWPALVLFMRRLHDEGRLEGFLADPLESAAIDELFGYLRHELLAPLAPELRAALLLISAAPDLHVGDLPATAEQLPQPRAFAELEARGIVTRVEEAIEVPWIVRHILRRRASRPSELLSRLAETVLGFGDHVRAAELYLETGKEREAARCLAEAMEGSHAPDARRLHAAIARLSLPMLCRHRELWWTAIENVIHGEALDPSIPATTAAALAEHAHAVGGRDGATMLVTSGLLALHDGRVAHARRIFTTIFGSTESDEARFRAFVAAALSLVEAFAANAADSERWWSRACELAADAPTRFSAKRFLARIRIVCDRSELAASWAEIRTLFDTVLAHAGGTVSVRCAQSLFNAGFLLDDREASEYALRELQALRTTTPDRVEPLLALYGEGVLPRCTRLRVHLVHHAIAIDVLQRKGDIAAARALRDQAQCLLARTEDSQVRALIDRAARRLEAPRGREATPSSTPRTRSLELATGRCVDGSDSVVLPDRSVQLLALLALRARPVSRDELSDALWDDLDAKAQQNALKTCVHRTRALIDGGRGVLLSVRDGYAVSNLTLDVVEAERRTLASTMEDSELLALAELLERGLPSHMRRFECFAALAQRLRDAAERSWMHLGNQAIATQHRELFDRAVGALGAHDPLHEAAISLAIRWHLARGERSSAEATFERFRRSARRDIAASSAALERLLRESAS